VSDEACTAFLRRFRRGLAGARDQDRIVEEVLDHLHEAAAAEEATGADPDAARSRAIERFGNATATASAYPEAHRYWIPALSALAVAAALLVVGISVVGQVSRPCAGATNVYCDVELPFATPRQAHPLRATLDLAAAISAALLGLGFAASAYGRRRERHHAFQETIGYAIGEPAGGRAGARASQHPRRRWRAGRWVGALALLAVIVAAIGATVRGEVVSFQSPREQAYPLQHLTALPTSTPRIVGRPTAQPLLRWIVRQMPTDFTSVGVGLAPTAYWRLHGDYLVATSAAPTKAGRAAELSLELEALALAYDQYRHHPRWRKAPPIAGAINNPDIVVVPPYAAWRHYYRPLHVSQLRGIIVRRARQQGLQLVSLSLPQPDGVMPIVIARTPDPVRYAVLGERVLPREQYVGAIVIVEDLSGRVQAVLTRSSGDYGSWINAHYRSRHQYLSRTSS
jgi:hypothetical protein